MFRYSGWHMQAFKHFMMLKGLLFLWQQENYNLLLKFTNFAVCEAWRVDEKTCNTSVVQSCKRKRRQKLETKRSPISNLFFFVFCCYIDANVFKLCEVVAEFIISCRECSLWHVQEMFESSDSMDARITSLLEQGELRIAKSTPSDSTTQLRQSLDDISARWDAVKLRFIEHGNQLTAACDEAKQLNDRLTETMSWLSEVEQALSSLQPVSRVMDNIQLQIQQHHVTTLILLVFCFIVFCFCDLWYSTVSWPAQNMHCWH